MPHIGCKRRRNTAGFEMRRFFILCIGFVFFPASYTTAELQPIQNTITVGSAQYIYDGNSIEVNFAYTRPGEPTDAQFEWGLTVAFDSALVHEIPPNYYKPLDSLSLTDTIRIPEDSLRTDTTHWFGLWLRAVKDGETSPGAPPGESGVGSVEVGSDVQAEVSFDVNKSADSISVFGGKVIVMDDLNDIVGYGGVVHLKKPSSFGDFISLGASVQSDQFINATPEFRVSIRYETPPEGISADDIRIYRDLRDSLGIVLVDRDSYVKDGYVHTYTKDLAAPLMVLVDTKRPELTILSEDTSAIDPGTSVPVEFTASDNVGNALWSLLSAPGNAEYDTVASGKLTGGAIDTTVVIPGAGASKAYGLRAELVIDDGGGETIVDLSRQVWDERDEPGIQPIPKREWTPVRTTSILRNTSVKSVVGSFFGTNDWTYDIEKVRLFRWYPYNENSGSSNKWVEYSSEKADLFSFVPGRLMWVKRSEDSRLEYGIGKTPSLKECVTIELPPKNWTDVATPFEFPVLLDEVLDSTGPRGDSLQVAHWVKSEKTFRADDFYIPSLGVGDRATASLKAGAPSDGYSFYNPFDEPVTLRIPPIPPALSEQRGRLGKTVKRESPALTGVRLVCTTDQGVHLNPAICALARGDIGAKEFPQRPSFAKYGVAIQGDSTTALSAHAIREAKSGGRVFPAVFYNYGETPVTFDATVTSLSGQSESEFSILASDNGSTAELEDRFTVTVSPGARETRWIAVGTGEYLQKAARELSRFKFAFAMMGPNPFRNELKIQYTVPLEGMKSITVEIRDMAGRLVRQFRGENNGPGMNRVVWDGRSSGGQTVGTGTYIVRLTGEPRSGDKPFVRSVKVVRIAK